MKFLLVMFVLVFATLISHSQEPKTVINCYIRDGKVNYGHLAELLPDSIQPNLIQDVFEASKLPISGVKMPHCAQADPSRPLRLRC